MCIKELKMIRPVTLKNAIILETESETGAVYCSLKYRKGEKIDL